MKNEYKKALTVGYEVEVVDLDGKSVATFKSEPTVIAKGETATLGIDVDTRRLHVAVEGQCLIEFVRHVQPHVFGQSAVVGIEVAVAPLVLHEALMQAKAQNENFEPFTTDSTMLRVVD